MAFDQIHAGRREQQQYQNDEKRAEQRPVFIGNDPAERLQRRRVAHEHEEAEEPEHPKQAQIQRIQPVQIPGQKREEVDDHHRPHRVSQPCLPAR
jgi:hypothetical protein